MFFYTCPSTAKVRERMISASSRAFVLLTAEKEVGLEVVKKVRFSHHLFCLSFAKGGGRGNNAKSTHYKRWEISADSVFSPGLQMEASSPEEITSAALEEEFRPKAEEKRGFERPKRPGRR